MLSYSETIVKRKLSVNLRNFQLVSSLTTPVVSSSSFLLGPNPFSHYLNSTTLRKLCQALFLTLQCVSIYIP